MADVNTSILKALEAGYHPQEIMDHIKNSADPAYQEWYSNYSANMADRAKEGEPTTTPSKPTTVGTPLLNAVQNLTPAELAAAGIATTAVVKAPGLYNAYQERQLDKKRLSLEERRINAYEQQVGKQGMTAEPTFPAENPYLTTLEEARINTERARAEAIQAKIALEERKVAAMEAKAKANAERKAANVPTPKPKEPTIQLGTGGIAPSLGNIQGIAPPVPSAPSVPLTTEVGNPPKEMGIVKAGTENTLRNQIYEEIKAAEPITPVVEKSAPPPKAPKPKMEMPEGWGKGMSWLVNQHGIEGAQDFIDRYNNGKPFATYDEMMKAYQEKTTRPKYSDIPKDVRKSRGIVPPPQGGGMGVPPPRMGGGGRLNETGRPGEEIIHNLNPLKL